MARARRRSNREGSIWQRKDGRWTGAAYVLAASGSLKRVYVYGRTRDDVHIRLVQLQDSSARGIPRPGRGWKVGEYLDYWLTEVAKPVARPTTYAKYETMIRLYLRPGLGGYRLARLSVAIVQAYLNGCLQAGHSSATVHAIRRVLSAALTRAMREELVQRNVARLASLPPERPTRQQPWSADEARRFLAAALRDPMYPAFVLLLICGLRRGEVLGLSWRDVDFEHGIVRVRQQLVRAGSRLHIGPVKTAAGRRELPLLGLAYDALASQEEMRLIGGRVTEWTRYEFVFLTKTGHPIEPRNLARSFKRIIIRAGLRPIRLHDLRHTTATLLKNLGVGPRDAMEILGHSRVSVTLEIYTDGDEDTRRRALKRLSQELGRSAE